MINVTGTAPRCGTSAMMRELLKEYKPHSYAQDFPDYVAREKNPEGFWDINKKYLYGDDPIPYEEACTLKMAAHSSIPGHFVGRQDMAPVTVCAQYVIHDNDDDVQCAMCH